MHVQNIGVLKRETWFNQTNSTFINKTLFILMVMVFCKQNTYFHPYFIHASDEILYFESHW